MIAAINFVNVITIAIICAIGQFWYQALYNLNVKSILAECTV